MPGAKARLRLDGADPINRDLDGFWPFADGAGTAAQDISPLRRDLQLYNSPSREFGRLGRNVNLASASSQYAAPARTTYSNKISLVAWVKPVAAPAIGGNTWLMTVDDAFGINWNNVYGSSVGAAYVATVSSGFQLASLGGTSITAGVWHCLVVTWDNVTLRAYRNGVLTGSVTPGSGGVTWTAFAIGRNASAGVGYFNGNVALVRKYNRAITPGEVRRLYSDPWAGTARGRRIVVPGAGSYTLAVDALAYEHTLADVGVRVAKTLAVDALAYEHTLADVGLEYHQTAYTLDVEPLVYGYRAANVGLTYDTPATSDTHDGYLRRSRRQRALDAAEKRLRDERVAEAVALRLAIEAAMGEAADVAEEAPAPAVEAVTVAVQQARRFVAPLAVGPDPAVLEAARAALVEVRTAIAAADRARMLAEDDEDVLMLLRAL